MKRNILFVTLGLISSIMIQRYFQTFVYVFILGLLVIYTYYGNKKYGLPLILGSSLLLLPLIFINNNQFEVGQKLYVEGEVTKTFDKIENYQRVEIKLKDNKKISLSVTNNDEINLYDNIIANIEITDINTLNNFNLNNMENYYYINYISNSANAIDIENYETTSLIKKFKNKIINTWETSIDSGLDGNNAGIVKKLVLSNSNDFEDELNDIYSEMGISHLLAISGLHIFLIIGFSDYILKKSKVSYIIRFTIIISVLILYSFILDFPSSINRAVLMYSIKVISDIRKIKLSNIDIIFLSAIIILTFSPRSLFELGFQLSYLSVLGINILKDKLFVKSDSKIVESFIIYMSVNILLFPILAYNFNNFNIFSFISNLFMTPLIMVILILSYVGFLLDLIIGSSLYIYSIINTLLDFSNFYLLNFNRFFDFKLKIINPNMGFLFTYYFVLIVFLSNNLRKFIYKYYKELSPLYLLVLLFLVKDIIFPYMTVGFYDVGQGDSAYISYKDNYFQIDTGGTVFSNYNPGEEITAKAIIKKGIDVDLLFLSHYDADHVLGTEKLINEGLVKTIVSNPPDFNNEIYDEISKLDVEIINPQENSKLIVDENLYIEFLNVNNNYTNPNDSSLVLLVNYLDKKILFTGDISENIENNLIENIGQIDILKVSHHGSDTGTSQGFVNSIRPKYSVISVGKNNSYGHPNDSVIKNLENVRSKIFRTDLEGEIIFKISDDIKYSTYNNINLDFDYLYIVFSVIISFVIFNHIKKLEEDYEIQWI